MKAGHFSNITIVIKHCELNILELDNTLPFLSDDFVLNNSLNTQWNEL